ncbi:uncharacterized protein TRIADDRAFT_53086 [Trichoplax adhaerens]|uniref:E2 ubiquitin-conjugating enzyme n=1 Tax=Trichoplax adhaerens TaxID=10228 RepID=B3RN95_TRIAD|nr:hypothetical protein TRIADDRAFT_53086 [Trichoplax adhaerens]EDV27414.1 hypothetical protein TRIADDRAFT_53086 [Trichoplax adhaerens]|eukprot:XP_002109248.1 hypothetical protein TRIADDRAFT_53086 [Trichoplax adhaerens]
MAANLLGQALPSEIVKRVIRELGNLMSDPPEGIKIFPNDGDVTTLYAAIEGPVGTPYEGGIFRLKLMLGKDFPMVPPQGYFLTKIFHPNVAQNGAICVNTLKKDWKPDYGIQHILLTIKCLLIVPNPESALNEEAGRLLLERYIDYSHRAMMMTEIHAMDYKKNSLSENVDPAKGEIATKRYFEEKKVERKTKDKKRALKRL